MPKGTPTRCYSRIETGFLEWIARNLAERGHRACAVAILTSVKIPQRRIADLLGISPATARLDHNRARVAYINTRELARNER